MGKRRETPDSEKGARNAARDGEQPSLEQRVTQDSGCAVSKSEPGGDFTTPSKKTGRHQVGQIDQNDDEDQTDRRKQHQQPTPLPLENGVAQRIGVGAEAPIDLGLFLRQSDLERFQLPPRLFPRGTGTQAPYDGEDPEVRIGRLPIESLRQPELCGGASEVMGINGIGENPRDGVELAIELHCLADHVRPARPVLQPEAPTQQRLSLVALQEHASQFRLHSEEPEVVERDERTIEAHRTVRGS